MIYLFILICAIQMVFGSVSKNSLSHDHPLIKQAQDRFAHMFGIKLLQQSSVDERYDHLKCVIDLLRSDDDALKKLTAESELLKKIIASINSNDLPKTVSLENSHNKDELLKYVQNETLFLMHYFKHMHALQEEYAILKKEHENAIALRKNFVALQEKYNASFSKNFFDFITNKPAMRFFGATIGLIVFMNAACWWDLNPVEHMIITMVGLSGFFAFIMRLYD